MTGATRWDRPCGSFSRLGRRVAGVLDRVGCLLAAEIRRPRHDRLAVDLGECRSIGHRPDIHVSPCASRFFAALASPRFRRIVVVIELPSTGDRVRIARPAGLVA
jgi:hypothetical protein